MKRVFLLFFLTFLWGINSAFAVEFKPLEAPKEQQIKEENVSREPQEDPKGLLSDKDYKIKGRVEYDSNGVLFLDSEDVEKMNIKVNIPKKYPKKSVLSDNEIFQQLEEQRRYEAPKVDEYLITPSFGSLEYNAGKFSYGTTFGTEMDTAQLEYRTKLFARYDGKFIGVMTAVGKDAYTSSGRQMDSFYLVPELKLGKGFTLVDAFKANPEYERCRNEIMLRYSPKIKNTRENVQLEAGLSQTSYYATGEQLYQFSVSTKFKF
ncbi:hypothetical protein IJ843_07420 [bacterium]|nr:hypothetical protein [bacterium]